MNKGIVIAGALVLDRHYLIDAYPDESRLSHVSSSMDAVGGSGNIAIDLAKIDNSLPITLSAIIGSGSNGRVVVNEISKYSNINQKHIIKKDNTPLTLVMNSNASKERTFFYYPGDSALFDDSYVNWDSIEGDIFQLEYLLLLASCDKEDPTYGSVAARLLKKAQDKGMKTSFDMVSAKDNKARQLAVSACKFSNYCSINELEAEEITGCKIVTKQKEIDELELKKALFTLKDFGISDWVVIHWAKAGYGLDVATNTIYKVPSLNLPEGFIKGTTGAGDAYCAGILYSAYLGLSLEKALSIASATAAASLSETEGTTGMSSFENILKLYSKYKGEINYEEI